MKKLRLILGIVALCVFVFVVIKINIWPRIHNEWDQPLLYGSIVVAGILTFTSMSHRRK